VHDPLAVEIVQPVFAPGPLGQAPVEPISIHGNRHPVLPETPHNAMAPTV
jgi:hypothetical protein